jgi:hypothetical protein
MRHCRIVGAAVIASFLVFASPVLSQTATTPHATSKVHVYLVRGLMNIFSLGLDSIANKLRNRGIDASVHNHLEAAILAGQAIDACKSGRESQIILVGHSLGATAVVDMAQQMSQAGVEASLVVSLDPVTRATANGSVRRLINYYISNGVGQPVDRGTSFHGTLQNVDLRNNPEGGHIFLTNSEAMQQKVYNDVLAAIATHAGCRPAAAHAANGASSARPPGT